LLSAVLAGADPADPDGGAGGETEGTRRNQMMTWIRNCVGWVARPGCQLADLNRKLDLIIAQQRALMAQGGRMGVELDALTAQVKANTDLEGSVATLIQGLAAKVQEEADALKAAGADTTQLQALTSQLKGSADALSAAVVANTPAA
jgi:hypothetical protein